MKSLEMLSTVTIVCLALSLASAGTIPVHTTDSSYQQLLGSGDVRTSSTIRDALLRDEIIPEVLDDFEPIYSIDVTFLTSDHEQQKGLRHDRVRLGNEISLHNVQHRPVFSIHQTRQQLPTVGRLDSDIATRPLTMDKIYTLVLTDPDAKSRDDPKWSEMCHWIMTNLTTPLPDQPPLLRFDGMYQQGALAGELEVYQPPGPPPRTGPHRYVFVLLESESYHLQRPKERQHWGYGKIRHGVRDWAKDNNLTVIGANYFYAKNEKQ